MFSRVQVLVAGLCLVTLWSPFALGQEDPGMTITTESGVRGFPVRDAEKDSPLFVVVEILKAGTAADETGAFNAYLTLVAKDRSGDKTKVQELKDKEFKNLRLHASSYWIQDQYGMKVMVIKMTPGIDKINKETTKVYVTVRNAIEPEERSGVFIIERNGRGWVLRSVNL